MWIFAFQVGKDLLKSAASWPLPFSAGVQELDNLTSRIIVEIFATSLLNCMSKFGCYEALVSCKLQM